MEFKQYQVMARRTVPADATTKDKLANFSMGLTGEAGEVVDALKKHIFHGHELDKEHVAEELGDVIFYVFNLADTLGIEMSEVAEINYQKLLKRYPDGFDKEKSINRGK